MKRIELVLMMIVAALAAVPGASTAVAQEIEPSFPVGAADFALSVGYANISLGSESAFDNESALRFDGSIDFSPLREQLPQLRLGAGVGVSMVLDNSSRTIIISNGTFVSRSTNDIPFWLIEPELRLSWLQTFGDHGQFFIQPGVAGGYAFGFLDLTGTDSTGGSDTFRENDSTLYGRIFLRAGAQVTGGIAGIEASWLSGGRLDFGAENAAGDLREWYIGIFGALLF